MYIYKEGVFEKELLRRILNLFRPLYKELLLKVFGKELRFSVLQKELLVKLLQKELQTAVSDQAVLRALRL